MWDGGGEGECESPQSNRQSEGRRGGERGRSSECIRECNEPRVRMSLQMEHIACVRVLQDAIVQCRPLRTATHAQVRADVGVREHHEMSDAERSGDADVVFDGVVALLLR